MSSTQDFTGKPLDFIGIGLTGPRGLVVYLGILAILFALGYIAYTSVASGWSGSDWLLNLAMKSPALGGCLQSMALARFCWSLAIAHEAGMDARRTAAAALRSTENRWYTRHAAAIDNSLREGNEFHQALTPTGAFPAELLHTLETAEQSGQITETMFRMAAKHQEEGRLAAQTLTLMAGWACWVLVAGVIVLLIFRLALWYVGQINGLLDQIK